MDTPRLGPAHQALTALVGRWAGEEELAASPWAAATTATAEVSYRVGLNGFAVIQEYQQRRSDGGGLVGHGVFTVDPTTGDTLWYGFDSYGYPPDAPARGGWQEDSLILTKTTPRGVAKHVFTLSDDHLRHHIDIRMGDSAEFVPFMRASYGRVG
ncbi:DUF1579 family protein [Goodfellowiella coeruleoviolacea]|uniref:DUF1579 domain-containing protein n=1 Tax=Goodfellowiella coeruleoviolacea TaxID=334858 RepID=A0AAE3G9G4_9PSEU|nr:DUF1579 family protein [Goodfellowiella coeruleoviolacea]MCP2164131.1 Protein of unknown function (DUF1579) [Goodfellowiella coeruleoviolacea]